MKCTDKNVLDFIIQTLGITDGSEYLIDSEVIFGKSVEVMQKGVEKLNAVAKAYNLPNVAEMSDNGRVPVIKLNIGNEFKSRFKVINEVLLSNFKVKDVFNKKGYSKVDLNGNFISLNGDFKTFDSIDTFMYLNAKNLWGTFRGTPEDITLVDGVKKIQKKTFETPMNNAQYELLLKQFGKQNVRLRDISTEFGKTLRTVSVREPILEEGLELNRDPEVYFEEEGVTQEELDAMEESTAIYTASENYIKTKTLLKTKLETKLKILKSNRAGLLQDDPKYIEITSSIEEVKKLLGEGSDAGVIQELAELSKKTPVEKFLMFAETDFEIVDNLKDSSNSIDISIVNDILKFYQKIDPESEIEKNHLFTKAFLLETDIPQDVILALRKLNQKANNIVAEVLVREKKNILNNINNLAGIQSTFNKELTEEEVFHSDLGYKDVDWVSGMITDGTIGINSNPILRQAEQEIMENLDNTKGKWAKGINERIINVRDKLDKAMAKANANLNDLGIIGKDYTIFRAENNGLLQDTFVTRYSLAYTEAFKKNVSNVLRESRDLAKAAGSKEEHKLFISKGINEVRAWHKKNSIIINPNRLSSIVKDFPDLAKGTPEEILEHEKELKNLLGETGFQELVDKQYKKIKEYTITRDLFLNELLAEEGVTEEKDLSSNSKAILAGKTLLEDPFKFLNAYNTGTDGEIVKSKAGTIYNNSGYYNEFIPRKKEMVYAEKGGIIELQESEKETGFYDKKFAAIEADPALLEFYNIIKDVTEYIHSVLPPEQAQNFNINSILSVEKSLIEIVNDPNMGKVAKFSTFIREFLQWLRKHFTKRAETLVTQAIIDEETGDAEYTVSTAWLKSNKSKVNNRFKTESIILKDKLGISISKPFEKSTEVSSISTDALVYLADLLGIEPTKASLIKKLGSSSISLNTTLKQAIIHNEVMNQSVDLPKALAYFAKAAATYAARQEALPEILAMKRFYEEIKTPLTNKDGEVVRNESGEVQLTKLRHRAIQQNDSWFKRVVLGEYNFKSGFGDSKLSKVKYTKEEAIEKVKIETALGIANLEKETLLAANDPANRAKLDNLNKTIDSLNTRVLNLGEYVTVVSVIDGIFDIIRLKGLGWNFNAAIGNFMEGQLSNVVGAASNRHFKEETFWKAMAIVRGTTVKNMSFGTVNPPGTKKLRAVVDNYGFLQDASNELQKASSKSGFNTRYLKMLLPYTLVERIEYLNQTPVMLSIMMEWEITGKDGAKTNLWDALNEDGTLIENFSTPENRFNYENLSKEESLKYSQDSNIDTSGKGFQQLKRKVTDSIVVLQGDYSELKGAMASESLAGRAVLTFKKWMGMAIFTRIAKEQAVTSLGISDYKGRWRSMTHGQVAAYGAVVGTAFGGPVGTVIGAGVGSALGYFKSIDSNLNFAIEGAQIIKESLLKMIGVPVNLIAGKQVVKSEMKWVDGSKISKRDQEALQANITELAFLLSMTLMLVLVKSLAGDDKDDKEDFISKQTNNFLSNKINGLLQQTTAYMNPATMLDNVSGADGIAGIRFFSSTVDVLTGLKDLVSGEDTYLSGPDRGKSKLAKKVKKTFVPTMLLDPFSLGFSSAAERQYVPSEFDEYFWSEDRKAQKAIKGYRAEVAKYFEEEEGLTPEEAQKKVNKILKPVRKGKYAEKKESMEKKTKELLKK